MFRFVTLVLLLLLPGLPGRAETVVVSAARDVTLIEHPAGALANGAGPSLFVGRTGQPANGTRRALLYFDVAAALPPRAVIETVALRLHLSPSNSVPGRVRLHRVLADWGEGPSFSTGGSGAAAETGDATWLHTFFDDELWARPGAQFVHEPSAVREVGPPGTYVWNGSPRMARDVSLWRVAPSRNFGWILLGDETAPQTSKRFGSRESLDAALRPALEITYRNARR